MQEGSSNIPISSILKAINHVTGMTNSWSSTSLTQSQNSLRFQLEYQSRLQEAPIKKASNIPNLRISTEMQVCGFLLAVRGKLSQSRPFRVFDQTIFWQCRKRQIAPWFSMYCEHPKRLPVLGARHQKSLSTSDIHDEKGQRQKTEVADISRKQSSKPPRGLGTMGESSDLCMHTHEAFEVACACKQILEMHAHAKSRDWDAILSIFKVYDPQVETTLRFQLEDVASSNLACITLEHQDELSISKITGLIDRSVIFNIEFFPLNCSQILLKLISFVILLFWLPCWSWYGSWFCCSDWHVEVGIVCGFVVLTAIFAASPCLDFVKAVRY